MRGQLCINIFASYSYSANHMSFLYKKANEYIGKKNWSGVLKFLQSSGVTKKSSQPTALIEWEEMAFAELNLKLY